jgi:drug/metabolite transporter (DMT)-like permease
MILIAIGCVVLPMPRFRRLSLSDYRGIVYLMAIVAAVGTTGYTLIDDGALTRLEILLDEATSQTRVTVFYLSLQAGATAVGIVALTLARPVTRLQLAAVIRDRSLRRTGMLTGVVISATYALALAAMAYVSDVSYVAAFRQLSIPIGAALGIVHGGEAGNGPKLAGIAVVTSGLVLVGLG